MGPRNKSGHTAHSHKEVNQDPLVSAYKGVKHDPVVSAHKGVKHDPVVSAYKGVKHDPVVSAYGLYINRYQNMCYCVMIDRRTVGS